MRDTFLSFVVISLAVVMEFSPGIDAQTATGRALELLNRARVALGGEKLKSLQSLSVTGDYRRLLGEREMSGEIQFDLLLPDKVMKIETMRPLPNVEITRTEVMNGEQAWMDQQSSSGGMVIMRRPGGDTPQGQVAQQSATRAEFARLLIGWLLTTPVSFPVEFIYAGQAEAPDGTADVLEVKGPNNFAAYLFLDQQTHRPLMLSYKGKKPRMVMRMATGTASQEEIERRIREAEAEAAAAPEAEFQMRFEDYREVSGIFFPHRITKAIDNEINEEWEMKSFKLNPPLKPERFERKK